MRLELPHFEIEGEYGANQEKYTDFWMHLGGCAATCACESALLFKKYHGLSEAYPYDTDEVTREQFNAFTLEMKPYLRPRMMGIDRLSIYEEGFGAYLHDKGIDFIKIGELPGEVPYEQAEEAVRREFDKGFPVPALTLRHKDKKFFDFDWHWYLINGYEEREDGFFVRLASWGEYIWVSFRELWETGYERRGGLILYDMEEQTANTQR